MTEDEFWTGLEFRICRKEVVWTTRFLGVCGAMGIWRHRATRSSSGVHEWNHLDRPGWSTDMQFTMVLPDNIASKDDISLVHTYAPGAHDGVALGSPQTKVCGNRSFKCGTGCILISGLPC